MHAPGNPVNTRLKDYLDLVVVVEREVPEAQRLARGIAATFRRRGTALPSALPVGLSHEFALDPSRIAMWQALLKKNGIAHRRLEDVVTVCAMPCGPL